MNDNEAIQALEEAIKTNTVPEIKDEHTVDLSPMAPEKPPKKEPKYMSKDEWDAAGKDPEKYKTKEQFDHDGQYLNQIKSLQAKIKSLEEKSYRSDYEKYSQQKKASEFKRDQAILNGKLDQFYEANNELHNIQEPYNSYNYEAYEEKTKQEEHRNKLDTDFMGRNKSWWNSDSIENINMVEKAHRYADSLAPYLQNGSITPEKLLLLVEEQMRKEYPHKFGEDDDNPQEEIKQELGQLRETLQEMREEQSSAPSVESNSIPRSKFTAKDLPADVKQTYMEAVSRGLTKLTPKQYYDKLVGK